MWALDLLLGNSFQVERNSFAKRSLRLTHLWRGVHGQGRFTPIGLLWVLRPHIVPSSFVSFAWAMIKPYILLGIQCYILDVFWFIHRWPYWLLLFTLRLCSFFHWRWRFRLEIWRLQGFECIELWLRLEFGCFMNCWCVIFIDSLFWVMVQTFKICGAVRVPYHFAGRLLFLEKPVAFQVFI